MSEATIAAIATAPGEAGIGIVRLSGDRAVDILNKIFEPSRGGSIKDIRERRLTHGYIRDPADNSVIDEVLAVYMTGPYTYTAEDVAEIDCHGGIVPVKKILDLVLREGAVLAEPGEFTKRAFLNGRIDLAQAEAVMDLISAKTEKGFEIAISQLGGSLSQEVKLIRHKLLEMMANITVNIDFPDEDIEEITYSELEKDSLDIKKDIEKLLETAERGRIIKEGLNTVIVGKPNVGKSSLMNALLREARAIVTEIPGTTRDIIEEYINIKGIPLKIIDTAGIRETDDIVEKIGVQRSKEIFNKADLTILVLNASEDLTEEDITIIELLQSRQAIVLLNKTDLPMALDENRIRELLPDKSILKISLLEGKGIEELEDTIVRLVYGGEIKNKESSLITNVRHKHLLERALYSINEAIGAIRDNLSLDFVEVDIKDCWESLGEITGEAIGEDILNTIFSKFCIGK